MVWTRIEDADGYRQFMRVETGVVGVLLNEDGEFVDAYIVDFSGEKYNLLVTQIHLEDGNVLGLVQWPRMKKKCVMM